MMALDYPPDRLRLVVVDDASTDETPRTAARRRCAQYPGRVLHLRREQGRRRARPTRSTTGCAIILADDWAEAVLITDADVVFEPTACARMTRHLADPAGRRRDRVHQGGEPAAELDEPLHRLRVRRGAGRRPTRAERRAGAGLPGRRRAAAHPRQPRAARRPDRHDHPGRGHRHHVPDPARRPHASSSTATPSAWPRSRPASSGCGSSGCAGRAATCRSAGASARVFFRPSRVHHLGRPWFGLMWWSTLLLPAFMVVASAALVTLWCAGRDPRPVAVHAAVDHQRAGLRVHHGCSRCSSTGDVARRSVAAGARVPRADQPGRHGVGARAAADARARAARVRGRRARLDAAHRAPTSRWPPTSGCRSACSRHGRCTGWTRRAPLGWLGGVLMFVVGYGPLLCAITFAAYVAEARGAAGDVGQDREDRQGGGAV